MNVILYFQPQVKRSDTLKLMGVKQLAQKFGWRIQVVEAVPTRRGIRELIAFWNARGAIVECDGWSSPLKPETFDGLPTVFLDPPSHLKPVCPYHISQDSNATGRTAAKELLVLERKNFAFVPFSRPVHWSDERQEAFVQTLSLNGYGCSVFKAPGGANAVQRSRKLLRDFLVALPKPAALFAANDEIGETVIALSNLAGLRIPDDLAVLGVDNYEPICESTTPTLSSIEPDFLLCGERAAVLLSTLIAGEEPPLGDRTRPFGPARVIHRASTSIITGGTNRQVGEALELIRLRACQGLTADEVLKVFDCSRPLAYERFRNATGHTILEAIHAAQLERCKTLLADPCLQMKVISDFCGFTHPNSLRKFFLRETGMTMSAWRQKM